MLFLNMKEIILSLTDILGQIYWFDARNFTMLLFLIHPASKSVFNLTVWSIGFKVRGHSLLDSYFFHTPSVTICSTPMETTFGASYGKV